MNDIPETNCYACGDDISKYQFTYKDSHGWIVCIHCFAEDFKKQARIEKENKTKLPRREELHQAALELMKKKHRDMGFIEDVIR